MKEVYVAGKLFKKQDVAERIEEGKKLNELGYTYFNPIEQPFNEDKSKLPTAADIFKGDTQAVLESKIILAELDDEDPGVMAELGIAWAISHLHTYFKAGKSIEDFINDYPMKKIVAHATDIRIGSAGDYDGVNVTLGWNQYVIGLIEDQGKIFTNKEKMWESLKK